MTTTAATSTINAYWYLQYTVVAVLADKADEGDAESVHQLVLRKSDDLGCGVGDLGDELLAVGLVRREARVGNPRLLSNALPRFIAEPFSDVIHDGLDQQAVHDGENPATIF